jgi:hypothetical protein
MIATMLLMARKRPYQDKKYPERSSDVFVTQKMLYAVRDELKSDNKALAHQLRSEMKKLNHDLRGDMEQLSHELRGEMRKFGQDLRGDMEKLSHDLRSEMAKMSSELSRHGALAEEQNARNIAVIDALTSLFTRQERVETRIDDVEKTIASFKR